MIDGVIGKNKSSDKTGWKIIIDGVNVSGVQHLEIDGGRFGTFHYGRRVEGYDSVVYKEPGGGGSVTLPYVVKNGEVYVALVEENRPNMGGNVWCVIGGMLDADKTHKEQQVVESAEEAGFDTDEAVKLPGLDVNSNRLFWVANPNKGEGVHMFALELPKEAMKDDLTMDLNFLKGVEKLSVKFFKIYDIANFTADTLALSAAFKLLSKLHFEKEENWV